VNGNFNEKGSKMSVVYPTLEVWSIASSLWTEPLNAAGLSLNDYAGEIGAAYHRLIKGGSRSQTRVHLMGWFERLQSNLSDIPSDPQLVMKNSVPLSESSMWLKSLHYLAMEMGNHYGGKRELKYPFLPAIWHPSSQETLKRKLSMDVKSHCQLLDELLASPDTEWVSGCHPAINRRQDWFRNALQMDRGIIEIAGFVYTSLGRDDS
jgi:hypothetical protein